MSSESYLANKELQDGPGTQRDLRTAVLFGLILLLGIALRLYDLGVESYWIDEMSTVIEGQQSIPQLLGSGRLDQPLAFYLPFRLWVKTFGATEAGARSFAALAGVGSIVLIYVIGRELFGEEVGLLSAFLMAISEFQIFHSQAARFYSFFEFITLLSYLFLILALKSKRKTHFALYVIASVLMVYSHAYGLFILAAQNLFFVLQGRKYRSAITTWLICQALILLAILPYFYPLIFGGGGIEGAIGLNIGGYSPPKLLDPLRSVYRQVFPPRRERSWETTLAIYAVAGVFLMAGAWIYAIRQGKGNRVVAAKGSIAGLHGIPDLTSKLLLVGCWLLCPIMLPFFLSIVVAPMYQDHYTISAAPALYLLLAVGLFSIRGVVPLIVTLGALVILVVPGLGYYYVTDVHEQWKEAAAYIEENGGQDEVIVFAPNEGIGIQEKSFDWYYRGPSQSCGLHSVRLKDSGAISDALMQCISGHNRFWVIMNGRTDTVERFKSFFLNPGQTAMRLITERHFVGVSAYQFELTE